MHSDGPRPMTPRTVPGGHGLVSLFARHPNAANLAMILMVIFGLFACFRINTQFFPSFDIPVISVNVAWSGASAEDVEANVLQIMEPQLRFLDGVERVTSRAREGVASIGLEYAPGTDMSEALREAETAVKGVTNLPEDAEAPNVRQATASRFDTVASLALTGPVPEKALRFYAKKIRDDLLARGIDKVDFVGLRSRELRAVLPERELRRLGLTVADVSRSVTANSRDLPSGQMKGNVEKQLRAIADLDDADGLGEVEIAAFDTGEKVRLADIARVEDTYDESDVQGFSGGVRAIQIDVMRAQTADTLETHARLMSYLDEIRGLLPAGLSLTAFDVRAEALVERILLLVKNGLGGLVIVVAVLFLFLNARIAFWVAAGIPVALLATIGLLMVMGETINMVSLFGLIMMLGIIVDDAIVVGEHTATRFEMGDGPFEAAENGAGRMVTPVVAAMITTCASFGPILVIGDTFGQIVRVLPVVVLAVIIASLIECFLILPGHLAHTLRPRSERRFSNARVLAVAVVLVAAIVAIAETGGGALPELAARVTGMVNAILPEAWALPVPPVGEWVAAIVAWRQGIVVAAKGPDFSFLVFALQAAMLALLVSFAIEAALAALRRLSAIGGGRRRDTEEGWFRRGFDRLFDRFRTGPFDALVRLSFRWRYVTIAVALGCLALGAYAPIMGGKVGFSFWQSVESENINARVIFNAGTPEPVVVEALARIEGALERAAEGLTREAGTTERLVTASFVTLGQAGRSSGDNVASIRVQLTPSEVRTIRTPEVSKAWREAIPEIAGVRRVSLYSPRGGPPGRDIDIQLKGDDIGTLKRLATAIIPLVEAVPGASGVADDLPYGKPELVMQLTPRGSALGFTIEEVGRQLRNAFEGAVPRRFADGEDEVTIRISQSMRASGTAALRNFELKAPGGEFAPLSQVVTIDESQGFAAIERIDGKATVSVTADLDTDVTTTEQAIAALERAGLPGLVASYGASHEFSGRAEERRRAFNDLGVGALIALAIIYIVLAWVFASYWRPFAIMLIIPFGIVGAVAGHWLMGFKLTMLSMVALLGLAGILVNDSIVLVSRLDERLGEGDDLEEAAVGASRDRLRAVLLTSLTTIGGLVPLLFEKSLQAQFLLPMAITITFGLASATLLVLFLVPAFVGIGDDIRRVVTSLYGRRRDRVGMVPAE